MHAAGAGNMLKHTHMTLDSSAGLLGGQLCWTAVREEGAAEME